MRSRGRRYGSRRCANLPAGLLVLPAGVFLGVLFFVPLGNLAFLSFDSHQAGHVGTGDEFVFTVQNYAELGSSAYLRFFRITLQLSALAAALAVAIGFPIAYVTARSAGAVRKTLFLALI